MRDGVRAGMLDTAVTARIGEGHFRSRAGVDWSSTAVLPWAVAASLALVAGYQALWVVPGLRQDAMVPSVTVPQLLKPASRGAITTVTSDGQV